MSMRNGTISILSALALLVASGAAADFTATSSGGTWTITALDPQSTTCPGGGDGTLFAYTCTGGALDHAYLSFTADSDVCDAGPAPVNFAFGGDGDSKTGFGFGHASHTIVRFNPNEINCSFSLTVEGTVGPTLGDAAFSKGKSFEYVAVPVPQGVVLNPLQAATANEVERWKSCVFEKVRDPFSGEITAVNIISGNCVSDSIDQGEFAIQRVDGNGNPIGSAQGNLFTPENTTLTVGGETGSTWYQYDGRRWIRVTDCADPTDPRPPCP